MKVHRYHEDTLRLSAGYEYVTGNEQFSYHVIIIRLFYLRFWLMKARSN